MLPYGKGPAERPHVHSHGVWLRCATCAFMPTTHPPTPLPGMLAKIPEQAVGNLQRLLNTANSPIISMPLPGKRPAPSSSNSRRGTAASSSSTNSNGGPKQTSSVRQQRHQLLNSIGGFFSSIGSLGGSGTSSTYSSTDEDDSGPSGGNSGDHQGYYRSLGLQATAGTDEVKLAFRRLALTMHPDKVPADAGAAARQKAEVAFRTVQQAYEVLRDPEARAAYDQGRQPELDGSAEAAATRSR